MSNQYRVVNGECLASVAFEHGLLPETIWDDPANAELRATRDGFVLKSGDVLVVPDRDVSRAKVAAGAAHAFRRKSVPERLVIELRDAEGPRVGVPFRAEIGGALQEGTTNDKGGIELVIPPNAETALLDVGEDGRERYELLLGWLSPVEEESGVRARLSSLGYLRSLNASAEDYAIALGCFQLDHELAITQRADEPTCDALRDAHGC